MTSYERLTSVIKYRNSMCHVNTFSWNIDDFKGDIEISSNLFHFCGYCCYLVFKATVRGSCTLKARDIKILDVIIYLCGYPAPYRSNYSCQYSLFIKSDEGNICMSKTGEIQSGEADIYIQLFKGVLNLNHIISFKTSADTLRADSFKGPTICFSWSECGDSKAYSQGVQTEPERPIPVLERGTQTEGERISPTSKLVDNAEKESYKFLQILSNDFGSLHETTTDPDCVLKVGEVRFPVHRTVLSARSKVFAAMFHHDTSESQSGEVHIPDIDGEVFGDVLYYIYTGKIRGLSSGTAALMYTISDKYALIEFRDKCLNYLMLNLNVDNVGDAALIAHTHAEIQLENEIIQFIEENLKELMLNETWIQFSDSHSKLANKFLCSASIAIKEKFQKGHLS